MFLRKTQSKTDGKSNEIFPTDLPNSCEYCKHRGKMVSGHPQTVCKKCPIIISDMRDGQIVYRTWNRCDLYESVKICATCKHYHIVSKDYIVADTEYQNHTDYCDLTNAEGQKCAECIEHDMCKWEGKE